LAVELERHVALLVEDETIVAMIAEDYLTEMGFEPRWVQTAADALIVLGEHPSLRLAIIDIGLPDMRGDLLARRALEMAPGVSIILATGYDPVDLESKFSDCPTVHTLGKPYAEHDLRAAVVALGLTTTA
jgi:DNA-binding response OmpR family regulator